MKGVYRCEGVNGDDMVCCTNLMHLQCNCMCADTALVHIFETHSLYSWWNCVLPSLR